jgi:hypothetical protein
LYCEISDHRVFTTDSNTKINNSKVGRPVLNFQTFLFFIETQSEKDFTSSKSRTRRPHKHKVAIITKDIRFFFTGERIANGARICRNNVPNLANGGILAFLRFHFTLNEKVEKWCS